LGRRSQDNLAASMGDYCAAVLSVWLLDDGRLFVCGASSSYSAGQHPNGAVYIPQPVHM